MVPVNNAFEKPVAAIVQQVHQDQSAKYTALVNDLLQLSVAEDKNALAMGDKFVQIEQEVGRPFLKSAAKAAGIEWGQARVRHWVSSRIPPGHPLRNTSLTYGHLRRLAKVENMEAWAQKAIDNHWSVGQLSAELSNSEVQQAQQQGEPCYQCQKPLNEEDQIVAFSVAGKKRELCCGIPCAIERLAILKQAEPTASPSLIESLNTADEDEPAFSLD